MRLLMTLTFVAACNTQDPCDSITLSECADAAYDATDPVARARTAARACELGSQSGCSSLGLQLLLDSEHDDARRQAAYRAFRRSCSNGVSFLCTYPSYIEINRPEPNGDLVVNGFQAQCTIRGSDACHVVPRAQEMLGMPFSEEAMTASLEFDEWVVEYDIQERLLLNGTRGPQMRELPTLPTDTPGNLWTYGMDDAQ